MNEYKGYLINIEYDDDGDCRKAWHYFTCKATNERRTADITPYDDSFEVCRLFIDAGLPKGRNTLIGEQGSFSCNWDQKSLRALIEKNSKKVVKKVARAGAGGLEWVDPK